jgi:hypothetical protein
MRPRASRDYEKNSEIRLTSAGLEWRPSVSVTDCAGGVSVDRMYGELAGPAFVIPPDSDQRVFVSIIL